MKETANILGLIGIIVFALRQLLYSYLDASNGYRNFLLDKLRGDYFFRYSKPVKPQQKKIVVLVNAMLYPSWFLLGAAAVLALLPAG